MRLDRAISLNLVQPFRRVRFKVQGSRFKVQSSAPSLNPQPSTINSKWRVPILMYHCISDEPVPGVSPYYKVTPTPAVGSTGPFSKKAASVRNEQSASANPNTVAVGPDVR